jgi:hypothetical protein
MAQYIAVSAIPDLQNHNTAPLSNFWRASKQHKGPPHIGVFPAALAGIAMPGFAPWKDGPEASPSDFSMADFSSARPPTSDKFHEISFPFL